MRVLPHAPLWISDCGIRIADLYTLTPVQVHATNLSWVRTNPKFAIRNPKSFRKGSLTGKAVVLKTTARSRLQVRILFLPPTLSDLLELVVVAETILCEPKRQAEAYRTFRICSSAE